MNPHIAVIYYSAGGHVHQLAHAVAGGAADGGAEVRLRRVHELADAEAIRANPAWQAHHDTVAVDVPEAQLADLEWADGYAFGTPTRYGLPAAQLKQFLDQCGPLWRAGVLKDKVVTAFTSTQNAHGGHESTILALNNAFYHWGSLILPPDTTDPVVIAAGGNPYGTSYATGRAGDDGGVVPDAILAAARAQGRRLARYAALLASEPVRS
jgi:NAD(P)H dehydrogenase (quinone)